MLEAHEDELALVDTSYWWFQARYRAVERLLLRYGLASPDTRLLDWGCGAGGFLEFLLDRRHLGSRQVLGVEPGARCQTALRAKNIPFVDSSNGESLDEWRAFAPSCVTMLDVLEHIDDRISHLDDLRRMTAPGTTLIVTVPAFRFLWSRWDTLLGHKIRYTPGRLRDELNAGGWRMREIHFLFGTMFLPALLRSVLLRQSIERGQFPRVRPSVNRFLTDWYTCENRSMPLPFGTSLIAVADNHPHTPT